MFLNNPYIYIDKVRIAKKKNEFSNIQITSLLFLLLIFIIIYYVLFQLIVIFFKDYFNFFSLILSIPAWYLFSKNFWKLLTNQKYTFQHLALPMKDIYLLKYYLFKLIFSSWFLYLILVVLPIILNQFILNSIIFGVNFFIGNLFMYQFLGIFIIFIYQYIPQKIQFIFSYCYYIILLLILIYCINNLSYLFSRDFWSMIIHDNFAIFTSIRYFDYPISFSLALLLISYFLNKISGKIFKVKTSERHTFFTSTLPPLLKKTLNLIVLNTNFSYGFFYKDFIILYNEVKKIEFIFLPFLVSFGMLLNDLPMERPSLFNIWTLTLWILSNISEHLIKIEKKIMPLIISNTINTQKMMKEKRFTTFIFSSAILFLWCCLLMIFFDISLLNIIFTYSFAVLVIISYIQFFVIFSFENKILFSIISPLSTAPILLMYNFIDTFIVLNILVLLYILLILFLRRAFIK